MPSRWIFTEDKTAALQTSHITRLFIDRDVTHQAQWVLKASVNGTSMPFTLGRHLTAEIAAGALVDAVAGQ